MKQLGQFPRKLKCYKNASRLNRYNFPTDNAIDFLFSSLHTTPFHYEVLKIGSRLRYPLGCYSDSNAMHFYNILTVGQFSRKLSQLLSLTTFLMGHNTPIQVSAILEHREPPISLTTRKEGKFSRYCTQ